jgi:predicted metal-dependent peptidase
MKQMNRQDMERAAAAVVRKARFEILMKHKFYAVLLAQTVDVPSWDVPTMATDSVHHFYNPQFVLSQTFRQIIGTTIHECEHDARHHSTRRKGRDPKQWNYACDYCINPDLIDSGYVLPEGILLRDDLRGMGSEQIYRVLGSEQQQQQQDQPQQQHDEQNEDDSDDDATGTGAGAGDDESDDEGNVETEGDDSASDDGNAEPDGAASASDGEGERDAQGSGEGSPQSCGDGGCGEVLDAPGDEAEQADLDARWEVTARQAVSIAKKTGTLPGHWMAEIERRHTPTQNWKEVLREYIDSNANRIQTWNKPNRRFVSSGLVLPAYQRDGINKVCFIIDASGSMHGQHVKIANELQAALDDGAITDAVFVYCDTEVYHTDRFTTGDRIELAPIRLGGTDMRPAFVQIEAEDGDASLIICLTDLFIGDPGDEPPQQVLWCAYGDPRMIEHLGSQLPWGRVLDVDAD